MGHIQNNAVTNTVKNVQTVGAERSGAGSALFGQWFELGATNSGVQAGTDCLNLTCQSA